MRKQDNPQFLPALKGEVSLRSLMNYKMFIDDERFPITDDWAIVRSSDAAIRMIKQNGMPSEISFDHDLGGDDTSIAIVDFITNGLLDKDFEIPIGFKYSIHSQNPIGSINIKSKMDNIIRFIDDGK